MSKFSLKKVEEVKREADVLFDGIELANCWWAKTLTQDRQLIERVLVDRAAERKIKLREHSLISPLENYRIDDQEYGFDIAITLVKEVLQGKE